MVDDKIGMIIGGVIAILILVVGVLYYIMPALEDVEPLVEGKWKENSSPTSIFIIAFILIVVIALVKYLGIL